MEYIKKLLTLYGDEISITASNGLNNSYDCGPHYATRYSGLPLSIAEDECFIFRTLIENFDIKKAFIIGDGFGFSSNYISLVMDDHDGELVITLDNYSSSGDHARTALRNCKPLELKNVKILRITGTSPDDVLSASNGNIFDICFIDGCHTGVAPLEDFKASLAVIRDTSIVIWHDAFMPDIADSVSYAVQHGFKCYQLNSSCTTVVGSTNIAISDKIYECFKDLELENVKTHTIDKYCSEWTC